MKMKKKLSVLIAVILMMSLVPQAVFAADELSEPVTAEETAPDDTQPDDEQSAEAAEEEIAGDVDRSDPDTLLDLPEDGEEQVDELTVDEAVSDTESEELLSEDENTGSGSIDDVCGYTDADFEYEDNDTGVTITGFKGQDIGTLNIPATLGGKPVTEIGNKAFFGRSGFVGVLTFPNSVKAIGSQAFYNCKGFTSLKLPANLERLDSWAFGNCSAMKGNIYIPGSVTYMGVEIFQECNGFTSLTLAPGLKSLGDSAFSGMESLEGNLIIPDSVEEIGECCFWECKDITSVKLGSGLTSIGRSAFFNCSGMTGTVVIPNKVKTIGDAAFYGCTSITGLSLPEGLETLGKQSFKSCKCITGKVVIPKSVTDFGSSVFEYAGSGATLVLSEGLTKIGGSAFFGSGFKGAIVIPNSMTFIPDGAFKKSSGFTSLKLGNNITVIGSGAFSGCTGLKGTLNTPNTLTTIGNSAFNECTGFSGMKLSNNLTTLGYGAFGHCTGINTLTVPASVNSIDSGAFVGMYYVSKVVNKCSKDIRAYNFIEGDYSYFVKSKTGEKINRNGAIGKGTYTRKIKKLKTPTISSIQNSSAGIRIECNKIYGATKYVWKRSKSAYGKGNIVGRTSKPVFIDKKAKVGTEYFYTVYVTRSKLKSYESSIKLMSRVKQVTLKSVKNSQKGAMTVKWTKNNNANGYHIFYAKDKNMEVDQKHVTVTNKKTLSKTIKGLKKGQTYYVLVCAYKKVNGRTYTSYRSAIKSVKIKN